jgi:hypothetical protein
VGLLHNPFAVERGLFSNSFFFFTITIPPHSEK